MSDIIKLAVVTPIPTPYRDPFWNHVARQPGIDLHVFYCAAGKNDRPWKTDWTQEYPAETLPGRNLLAWRSADASCYWNSQITERLQAGQYDAVLIGGYNHLTMLAAIRWANSQSKPYFLMSESHLLRQRSTARRWLKARFVRRIVRGAAGGFPTGKLAEQYLVHYGAKPETLSRLPNVPDVEELSRQVKQLREQRDKLRAAHGFGNRPIVLFAGRLIPKKRVDLLIRSFAGINNSRSAQLVIVGDGPQRSDLRALAQQLGVQQETHFAGFVQPHEMPKWYAMSDIFVLPSSETWGVVAFEAIAAGLPIILSDEVGCHPDAVGSPVVGEVVRAGEHQVLATTLNRRLQSLGDDRMRDTASGPIIRGMRYSTLAQRLADHIHNTVGRHFMNENATSNVFKTCAASSDHESPASCQRSPGTA